MIIYEDESRESPKRRRRRCRRSRGCRRARCASPARCARQHAALLDAQRRRVRPGHAPAVPRADTTRSPRRSPPKPPMERRSSTWGAAPARCSSGSRRWRRRWTSRAWTSIRRWSRGPSRRRQRAIPAGGRRPAFVVADAGALPFPDASVDLLVSSYAVHHLPDRHAARAEIIRVLKPGGRAIIWDVASPHGAAGPGAQGAPPAGDTRRHAAASPCRSRRAPSTSCGCSSSSDGSPPSATSCASPA